MFLFLLKLNSFLNLLFPLITDQTRYNKGVTPLPKLVNRFRCKVNDVSHRLGTPKQPRPDWLIPTPKDKIPKPERLSFPPTPANGMFILSSSHIFTNVSSTTA